MNDEIARRCLYICDRKKCGERCHPECTHTSDIDHAVNFEFDGYEYIEKNCQDCREMTWKDIYKENQSAAHHNSLVGKRDS